MREDKREHQWSIKRAGTGSAGGWQGRDPLLHRRVSPGRAAAAPRPGPAALLGGAGGGSSAPAAARSRQPRAGHGSAHRSKNARGGCRGVGFNAGGKGRGEGLSAATRPPKPLAGGARREGEQQQAKAASLRGTTEMLWLQKLLWVIEVKNHRRKIPCRGIKPLLP